MNMSGPVLCMEDTAEIDHFRDICFLQGGGGTRVLGEHSTGGGTQHDLPGQLRVKVDVLSGLCQL